MKDDRDEIDLMGEIDNNDRNGGGLFKKIYQEIYRIQLVK